MTQRKRSLEDRLQAVHVTAANAGQMSKIKDAVARYGFNEKRIQEGKALCETAYHLYRDQKNKHNDQVEAKIESKKIRLKAQKAYMVLVKIARVALRKDKAALEKMELLGERKKDFSFWLIQAKQFYSSALSTLEILTELNRFNIIMEDLEKGRALVLEAEAANSKQEMLKADSRKATRERNEAFKKMELWRSDFITIARLTLSETPQLLESLGVVMPS
jgi:hypothetical protein